MCDIETTMKNGMAFDIAYDLIDKKKKVYESGSFLVKDVLAIEEPFYKDKIARYWTLAYKHKIKPMSMKAIRKVMNEVISDYLADKHKVVFCAYNAAFDTSHLSLTSQNIIKKPFLKESAKGLLFLDLWYAWVQGCPIDFGWHAPWTHGDKAGTINPKTGKRFPFNIKTSAEAVFRYISDNPAFIEEHIGYADLIIEKDILVNVLKRKKQLPIVTSPKFFQAMPWKIAQERCKVPIEARKNKQMSMLELMADIPDLTQKTGHMTEIVFPSSDPFEIVD